jgi:thioredoxin 1
MQPLMSALPYVLAAIVAAFAMLQLVLLLKARRMRGRPAPDLSAVLPDTHARVVLYFHSAHCGACRAMTPMVTRLAARHPNLVALDVAEHGELARQFGVSATPTLVRVENGVIRDVVLGTLSESKLAALVGPAS